MSCSTQVILTEGAETKLLQCTAPLCIAPCMRNMSYFALAIKLVQNTASEQKESGKCHYFEICFDCIQVALIFRTLGLQRKNGFLYFEMLQRVRIWMINPLAMSCSEGISIGLNKNVVPGIRVSDGALVFLWKTIGLWIRADWKARILFQVEFEGFNIWFNPYAQERHLSWSAFIKTQQTGDRAIHLRIAIWSVLTTPTWRHSRFPFKSQMALSIMLPARGTQIFSIVLLWKEQRCNCKPTSTLAHPPSVDTTLRWVK